MRQYVLAAAIALSGIAPLHAEEAKNIGPSIAIRGQGEYSIKPDYAKFYLTVMTREATAEKAVVEHARKIEIAKERLDAMKANGVEIKKSSFSMQTEQKMENATTKSGNRTQRAIGKPVYVAKTIYTLETRKIDALNRIGEQVGSDELFELSSISYDVDQPRQALLQARKMAVTDAREQAEVYAEAAGIKLVEVLEITDGEAQRAYQEDGMADLPTRRLAPGQKYLWQKITEIIPPARLNFEASVNIIWRIGPKP